MNELTQSLSELARIKMQISELEQQKSIVEDEVMQKMDSTGNSTCEWEHNGHWSKATIVRSSSISINEDGLKDSLTPAMWKKVTTLVLDKKALENMVATGKIDIKLVSDNYVETARKAYLRVTLGKSKE